MPLYIGAGSIVPMGAMIECATQSIDPQEVRVYEGVTRLGTSAGSSNSNTTWPGRPCR